MDSTKNEPAVLRLDMISDLKNFNWEDYDLLEVREFVEGGIYHPRFLTWAGHLNKEQTAKNFIRSKKERKSIDKNYKYLEENDLEVKILRMDEDLFSIFKKLYGETVLKKQRAQVYDLEGLVMGKVKTGGEVYLIGIFEGGKSENLLAALIFSVGKSGGDKTALVSFGAKKKINKLRGGLGGILEYELVQFCLENQITEISHGKGLCPVSLYSQAGIFEFKARYGFTAFPQGPWLTTFILNPDVFMSEAIFLTLIDNRLSYLIVGAEEKALSKYKTKQISNLVSQDWTETADLHLKNLKMIEKNLN